MARLRKSIALIVTASLALALRPVVDDLRRPPIIGSLIFHKAFHADLRASQSLFFHLGGNREIWDGKNWSVRALLGNGSADLIFHNRRCHCGERRPQHALTCVEANGSVEYPFFPVFDERADALGIAWRKGWHNGSRRTVLSISYWPLLALFAPYPLFGAIRWYRRRRRPGFCACGYDLTGNASGTCPECGRGLDLKPSAVSELHDPHS